MSSGTRETFIGLKPIRRSHLSSPHPFYGTYPFTVILHLKGIGTTEGERSC